MSTAIQTAQPSQRNEVAVWAETPEAQKQIAAALNGIMPVQTFMSHMLVAFQQKAEFRPCSAASKCRVIAECAALGVLPTLGQVALIVYNEKTGPAVKATVQWQGYKAVMERHPDILSVDGYLVHKSDNFTIANGVVQHTYNPLDPNRSINKISDVLGGYLVIVYRDGRPPKYHFTTAAHIEKCRACATTQVIWNKWPEQMILKTVYRDGYARRAVPIDPFVGAALQRATEMDDVALGNQPFAATPGESRTESLAKRLANGKGEQTQEPPPAAEAASEPPSDDTPVAVDAHDAKADEYMAQWIDETQTAIESSNTLTDVDTAVEFARERLPAPVVRDVEALAEKRRAAIRGQRGERAAAPPAKRGSKPDKLFDTEKHGTEH